MGQFFRHFEDASIHEKPIFQYTKFYAVLLQHMEPQTDVK